MKDYRLYIYKNGTLNKWGKYKAGNIRDRHFYKDLNEIEDNSKTLLMLYSRQDYQFVIVEYFGPYKSKIIKIIE